MRRQGAPSRHYPLTGNYPLSSGSAGGDARESSLSPISLPICLPLLYSAAGKIVEWPFPLSSREGAQTVGERRSNRIQKCFNERRFLAGEKKKREKKKEREARFARTVHLSVNRWPLGVLPGR